MTVLEGFGEAEIEGVGGGRRGDVSVEVEGIAGYETVVFGKCSRVPDQSILDLLFL